MSCVSVTQLITEDGKVQIDITNTSGRAPPLSRELTFSNTNAGQVSAVPDQDEPCSLIVSLRSSHPQFFFYRGPQPKPAVSTTVASPLRLRNGNGVVGGVGGGGHGRHRHSGNALWGNELVDPTILDVSRQTWKEHGFLSVATDANAGGSRSDGHHGGDDANPTGAHAVKPSVSPSEAAASAAAAKGDHRPLLVKEEMADCVLLPGERRTFFMEVGDPNVLSRLVAPKKSSKAASAWSRPTPVLSRDEEGWGDGGGGGGSSEGGEGKKGNQDGADELPPVTRYPNGSDVEDKAPNAPLRDGTDVFAASNHNVDVVSGNSGLRRSGAAATPNGTGKKTDTTTEDDDDDGRSPSRQPLSIVRESTTTRASTEAVRSSVPSRPQRRAFEALVSTRSSRDYAVPPSSSSFNSDTPSNSSDSHKVECGYGNMTEPPLPLVAGYGNAKPAGDSPNPATNLPYASPCLSHRPVFYVYYHPLGDENTCVDRARKWIAKEQRSYHEWRERLVRTVIEQERQRERGWTVTKDQTIVPTLPRLEEKRILPPVLGELVRWRSGDGGTECDNDPMEPSPVTIAAFYYYFLHLDAGGDAEPAPAPPGLFKHIAKAPPKRNNLPVVPPSFAATRTNRVSKKAKKMFTDHRQGAGTVVVPLRISSQKTLSPSTTNLPLRRDSTSYRGAAPLRVPSSMSAAGGGNTLRPTPSPPQQQRNESQYLTVSDSSANATPPMQASIHTYPSTSSTHPLHPGGFTEADFYLAGAATTPSEHTAQDSRLRRPRFSTGRGLALLDDSVTGSLSPTAYGAPEPMASGGDMSGFEPLQKNSFLITTSSVSSRWGRTETLDPEAAELAARTPPPPLDGNPLYSPSYTHTSLPSFPSTLEGTRTAITAAPAERVCAATSNPDFATAPFTAATTASSPLGSSSSGNHFNLQLSDDLTPPHDAAAEAAAAKGKEPQSNNAGSLVAWLLQSFLGRRGNQSDSGSSLDSDASPAHTRDISSAPPSCVAYRRRSVLGSTGSANASSMSGSGFLASRLPRQLTRLLAQSEVVKGTKEGARAAALLLSAKAGAAAVQTVDLLQQHGPTAANGVMMLLNLLKDVVFTPENVKVMEQVITPLVVVFSLVALLYLLFFGGTGVDAALPLLYNGGL
ncbi:hypothetical protein ABB37_08829 [Leptomonas pyrrhocoris]|uniref:Uncharacterized protein n=1 Tax=Leptomonas pyrrhocoris TaxID=157538 RepID=A0A0M9FSM9_LEPPY|nr:hypothetical protein ABB37_08829 [Leptomonas pyrrhocoris]KPA75167.1 hypothetical protein ABB37_08829 [Leptomonas pyrrhocoris]|eukprot:XP_015653606.1 hypothetical protein ABB37_08829 [Leptomonas pyrrhocoris]